jgi:indolepyruvate ferredoxin oxidoreductase alpha subunit
MSEPTLVQEALKERVLLGDEAVALGAIHAGITAAYAYPGTPSTEILEFIQEAAKPLGRPKAGWCVNEKTAYEAALGVSMAGRRALVSMKHVGLNVAADPFINSAIVHMSGGLVLAVADDPGMHSSQNEQDSRYLADFAHTLMLEPSNQQECYDMTREAFELSERFHIPVMVRLVTRLAHSRTSVSLGTGLEEKPLHKKIERNAWVLLPANARRLWRGLLDRQKDLQSYSEDCSWNHLELSPSDRGLGVITTGIARNYYLENLEDLGYRPSHLHIGAYPFPVAKIRALAEFVDRILVLEEGYPYVERWVRGILPQRPVVRGKLSGTLPRDGELTPDLVRRAMGLTPHEPMKVEGISLPGRPPQLCKGCPHRDSYDAVKLALKDFPQSVVASDIGCYTLGALPPYQVIESCVCMGASIGMARGASAAGIRPALAVIGDSTFLHSGATGLMDAVAEDADMTVLILDNQAIAMTGAQPTALPSSSLENLVLGIGVNPEHFHVVEAHPKKVDVLADVLRREMAHPGLSVVIAVRTCVPAKKKFATAHVETEE